MAQTESGVTEKSWRFLLHGGQDSFAGKGGERVAQVQSHPSRLWAPAGLHLCRMAQGFSPARRPNPKLVQANISNRFDFELSFDSIGL